MKCRGNNIGRRSFMHIGMLGGVGLGLSDFFRIKKAQADQKFYESVEGPAKSVIFLISVTFPRQRSKRSWGGMV